MLIYSPNPAVDLGPLSARPIVLEIRDRAGHSLMSRTMSRSVDDVADEAMRYATSKGWTVYRIEEHRGKVLAKVDRMHSNPLSRGCSRESISNNIRKLIHEGYPQRQAVAISLSNARRSGCRVPRRS